jgi:hypothetical protein
MFIPELKEVKAVELFLHKAERHREVEPKEIIQIIKMDKHFDVTAFTRN